MTDNEKREPEESAEEPPEIEISWDDLEDVPERPAAAAPAFEAKEDVLVIDSADLVDIPAAPPAPPPVFPPAVPPQYPPVSSEVGWEASAKTKQGPLAGGLSGSLLLQMALAGALGGLLAWALNEPVSYLGDTNGSATPADLSLHTYICLAIAMAGAGALGLILGFSQGAANEAGGLSSFLGPLAGLAAGLSLGAAMTGLGWLRTKGYVPSEETAVLHTTIFACYIGLWMGLCIGIVEGIYEGNISKLLIGGIIGQAIGIEMGALGGLLGQLFYGWARQGVESLDIQQILARTFGWGIVGVGIGVGLGLAHGLPSYSAKKIVNGLMGGAAGGFIGGFLFDPLSLVLGGLGSRLLAITLIGALSGAAIGLIEEIRKEAWIAIISGPLAGKQFILYNAITTIGSSPKCDIALLKDPHIAPQHCVIQQTGGGFQLRSLGPLTIVNGHPIQQHSLRAGDRIQIGATLLEYQDRALRS